MLLIFAILLIIILVVLVRCIVIVPQSNAYVTEWLGVAALSRISCGVKM